MKQVHTLTSEEVFCLEGCGSYKQYHHMRSQFESGDCPFCTIDPKVNKVIFENDSWRAWHNSFANKRNLETMLVVAHKNHLRSLTALSEEDWINLSLILKRASGSTVSKGGILFMRFGDMHFNAGTVPHLHWNLWVPSGNDEVRIPVVKKAEERAENQARAREFAYRYNA